MVGNLGAGNLGKDCIISFKNNLFSEELIIQLFEKSYSRYSTSGSFPSGLDQNPTVGDFEELRRFITIFVQGKTFSKEASDYFYVSGKMSRLCLR